MPIPAKTGSDLRGVERSVNRALRLMEVNDFDGAKHVLGAAAGDLTRIAATVGELARFQASVAAKRAS